MRKVIYIGEEPKGEKGVEFTHCYDSSKGWVENDDTDFEKIVYLGKCKTDGDMFACYYCEHITIFKGHLNNGTY